MRLRRSVFWMVGLLLSGCTLVPTVPSLPTPVRAPEIESVADALQAVLDGAIPPSALTLRYEVGNPAWQGRTTLEIRGGGDVTVTFEQGEQLSTWQASLPEEEFLDLVQLLVDHQVWAIRGQRETGVPDEAYPTVTVSAEGVEPLQVGMWHGEAQDHPGFGPIVAAFEGIAREVSGGVAR